MYVKQEPQQNSSRQQTEKHYSE